MGSTKQEWRSMQWRHHDHGSTSHCVKRQCLLQTRVQGLRGGVRRAYIEHMHGVRAYICKDQSALGPPRLSPASNNPYDSGTRQRGFRVRSLAAAPGQQLSSTHLPSPSRWTAARSQVAYVRVCAHREIGKEYTYTAERDLDRHSQSEAGSCAGGGSRWAERERERD